MKATLSFGLIASLCVTAVLVSGPTCWAQTYTKEKKADSAAKPEAKDAADAKEAEEKETEEKETDPYAVPDGDAQELVSFIVKLRKMRPRTREEYMVIRSKQPTALNEAATKLLALDPPERHAVLGVQIKAQALASMARMGNKDAGTELTEFLSKMKKDDRKSIANIAVSFDLKNRASKWRQMDDAQKTAVIDELLSVLGNEKPGKAQLSLVRSVVGPIARSGDSKRASEIYTTLIPLFRTSEDPAVAKYADKFEGMIRKMNLVGNSMEVKGTLLDGAEVDWAAYKGKVVLVDFWATWCGPCVAELPNVLKNYELYHDKGFDVIGISLDTNKDKVEQFVKARKIPWPIVYSDDEAANGWNHPMADYYGITGIPTAILVNQEGKVVTLSARGPALGKQLEELLGKAEADDSAKESKDGGS